MRYPDFLNKNGTIGFTAPSFGATTEPYRTLFLSALDKFQTMGYKTVVGENCFKSDGIGKSTTAENCAKEINDFFCNTNIDSVISCGGGETMCEDLPFVDFKEISKAKPKWFMGYSDNTNLVFTLPTLCDTAAIYGPCASVFGTEPYHKALYDAIDVLSGIKQEITNYEKWEKYEAVTDNLLEPYNCTEDFSMRLFMGNTEVQTLETEGRLLGGCLDCLSVLCGTEFDRVKEFNKRYEHDGTLWFLEACDLNPMEIRRSLWQLKNSGWFNTARGFLIGRPLHIDDTVMGLDRFNSVIDTIGNLNVPVFFDLDIGHLPPMMPIVAGAIGKVKAVNGEFRINYIFE